MRRRVTLAMSVEGSSEGPRDPAGSCSVDVVLFRYAARRASGSSGAICCGTESAQGAKARGIFVEQFANSLQTDFKIGENSFSSRNAV